MKFIIKALVKLRNHLIYKWFSFNAFIQVNRFPLNPNANFVISIASYPKRIHLLPAIFEALAKQTIASKHIYIVLSEEEWPELKIPRKIQKLVQRGAEIVWTKNNPYAVKKLVPIIDKHPDLGIITLDDDLLYGSRVIENLVLNEHVKKGRIVGHVGKVLHRRGSELGMMFRDTEPASLKTKASSVYFLGGSGTIYPPGSLDSRVKDIDAIHKIVPGRGSDIWFWAAAIAKGTRQVCLGTPTTKDLYIEIPQNSKTIPADRPGKEVMEQRFQNAIDYFGIREVLLKQLPNKAS